MNDKIAAYEKILKLVTEEISEDRVELSKSALETVIENLKVSEKFGIPLQDVKNNYHQWLKVGNCWDDYMVLGYYGEGLNRSISWSDDDRQPKNEWLLYISFPTGAFIFGDSYPTATFKMFWDELKAFGPKYSDTANHGLYFTEKNAKAVYDDFYILFDKYKALVSEELKAQRKEKLLKELEELSND
jgi:hypothetical protein